MGQIKRTLKLGSALATLVTTFCVFAASGQAATLFTGNQSPGSISSFRFTTSGQATAVSGSPFATTAEPRGLIPSQDGTRLYSGHRTAEKISQHAVGADGTISSLGPDLPFTPTATGYNTISPDGHFLYAVSVLNNGGLQYFSVGADGSLTSAGTTALLSNGGGLAITRDGKFLYVCTATKGLYGFSLGSNGAPSTLPGFPMTNRSCDDVAITPNGHFLVTVESGIGVRVYSPGGTGALTDVSGPTLIGPNPNSIEIAPDGKNFYIENIGSGSLSGTIAQFNLAADGTATHFGTDAVLTVPTVFANGLAISPDGRYIVATVNTVTSNILVFATNGGGQLTPAPGSPASSGASMAAGSPLQEVVFRTNQGPSVTRVSDTGSDRSRTFSAVGATDPDGSVGSYVWDFGDGSTSTTTTAAVKHKYAKNRIYNVSVSVVDDENCGASDIFDGRKYFCNASGGSTATTAADVLPPVFSKLKLSKKSASSGSKLKLSYKLSEAAKVKVTFQLRSGKKYKSKGSLTFASKSGKRSKKLTLKIKGKKLPVGKYRVLVAGTDGAKNTSSAKRLKLTVR